jgi:hypothetical protein
MRTFRRTLANSAALMWVTSALWGATFGTVVQIGGHVSDIALDDSRNVAYIANYTANRIEVLNRATNSLEDPFFVWHQPAAIALSPDSQYLVVVHYTLPFPTEKPAATIINLKDHSTRRVPMDREPLAVAFGNSSRALITTIGGFKWLDPATGTVQDVPPPALAPNAWQLPVPFATFPPEIMKASAGVSGDGNVIYVLADIEPGPPPNPPPSRSLIATYNIATGTFLFTGLAAAPDLGPRVISVDKDGSHVVAGWALLTGPSNRLILMAEFPAPAGSYNVGGHAFDYKRGLIYGHIPTWVPDVPGSGSAGSGTGQIPTEPPVLTIFDSDNLTVRERFHLQENLAGKALLSEDGQTLYAASDSGLTIFPIGSLDQQHRVAASVEDLLLRASGCQSNVLTQDFQISDPGGGHTDFALSTQSPGVHVSPTSGTTPARISVSVDLSAFQNQKGTVAVPITISSNSAINIPSLVRVLVNFAGAEPARHDRQRARQDRGSATRPGTQSVLCHSSGQEPGPCVRRNQFSADQGTSYWKHSDTDGDDSRQPFSDRG